MKYKVSLPIVLLFLLASVLLTVNSAKAAYSVDLRDFIVNGKTHYINGTTGQELIQFSSGPNGEIRMWKGSNWEEFILQAGQIRRRADTSWAPYPVYGNVQCSNGEPAAYTLDPVRGDWEWVTYTEGNNVPLDGAMWIDSYYKAVGATWYTQYHQVVTINEATLRRSGEYKYCDLKNSEIREEYESPNAAGKRNRLELQKYYASGTFEFCTGVINPEPVIAIKVLAGPGVGDLFFYMEGFGLSGFDDGYHKSGFTGDGSLGDPSKC
ncbi:MAG: hypothetical protein ACOZAO_03760 [Patescibacteria group bacterium]